MHIYENAVMKPIILLIKHTSCTFGDFQQCKVF